MTEIVSNVISKPSRVHNLAYVILGYVIASALVSVDEIGTISDYLLVLVFLGGIISTFLFYIQPVDKLLNWYVSFRSSYSDFYRQRFDTGLVSVQYLPEDESEFVKPRGLRLTETFYSRYLTETKGKIMGGFFFSASCVVTIFNPNLSFIFSNIWNILAISLVASIVFIVALNDAPKLKLRAQVVNLFYNLAHEQTRFCDRGGIYNNRYLENQPVFNALKNALGNEEWVEAITVFYAYIARREDLAEKKRGLRQRK